MSRIAELCEVLRGVSSAIEELDIGHEEVAEDLLYQAERTISRLRLGMRNRYETIPSPPPVEAS